MHNNRYIYIIRIILSIMILGGMMMLCFFGCKTAKYTVDYGSQKSMYENAKDRYRAGERVKLYYTIIATDTDYHFYLDGEEINYSYDENIGFIIEFIMPDHDVRLECVTKNSMEYDPFANQDEEIILIDYYDAVTGTDGYDSHKEYVIYAYDNETVRLVIYTQNPGEEESFTDYYIPYEAVTRCYEAIEKNGFSEWENLEDGECIDGGFTSLKYKDGNGYIRVSTDWMPQDGLKKLDEIKIIIEEYIP